ncbi:hypothetical protein Egran_02196 [Elaphomyces granulatus]|uniref:Zn(2)-C6 fungal-type domain-containing protein n=1 Tax=Elaphomyces granulatus TaxID=519963 RepID=A0A232M0V9_9EURO|nr:hypothetical protein Egran_02196 [Elaphomyces granulatus]
MATSNSYQSHFDASPRDRELISPGDGENSSFTPSSYLSINNLFIPGFWWCDPLTVNEYISPPWYQTWLGYENGSTQPPAVIPTQNVDPYSLPTYHFDWLDPLQSPPLGTAQVIQSTQESNNSLQYFPRLQNGLVYGANSPLAPKIQSIPPIPSNPPSEPSLGVVSKGDNIEVPAAPNRKRLRAQFTDKAKAEYREVRAKGSCLRCKVLREKCDGNTPCGKCEKIASHAKIFKDPCYRERLEHVITFRPGNSRMGALSSELPHLAWPPHRQHRKLQIRYPFTRLSDRPMPTLTISCREFSPSSDDILSETWKVQGQVIVLDLPPYACENPKDVQPVLEAFVTECRPFLLEEITARKGMVETPMDHINRSTLLEAIRYSRAYSDSPVAQALKIKFAAQMFSKPLTLYGSETLGVQQRLADKGVTYYDQAVPLPTFLNYQLDTLAMMCIQGYQKNIIKSLQAKIFTANRGKNWYEVFLTIFVLLGNLEHLYQAQRRYIQRHKKTGQDSRVSFVSENMMGKWAYSAENLITHFRVVLGGSVPFSKIWDNSNESDFCPNLDDNARKYTRSVTNLLREQKRDLLALKKDREERNYDRPFVWVSQLFLFE